mgnify:CR=1 FL=1
MLRNEKQTYEIPHLSDKQNIVLYKLTPALFTALLLSPGICLDFVNPDTTIRAMVPYLRNVLQSVLTYI